MKLRYIITILSFLFIMVCSFPTRAAGNRPITIVIDAGHGGHDVGAVDNGAREKDINLGVALALGEMIEKNLKGVKVVYTRKDDTFKALQERADIANKAQGDLFISIHTNSVDAKSKNRSLVEGASVYALGLHKDDNNMKVARRENSVIELEDGYKQTYQGFDPNRDESYIVFEMAQKKNLSKSIKFANDVQKQLVATAGRKDRGVHQAGFWVLWATSMPAVLVELDFICNPTSTRFMTSPDGKKKLAQSIFNAVQKYVEREKSSRVNPKSRAAAESPSNPEPDAVAASTPENDGVPLLVASTPDVDKQHRYKTPDRKSGARKRRGAAARKASEDVSYEVASIVVHTDADNEVIKHTPIAVAESTPPASQPADKKSSKKHSSRKGRSKVQRLKTVYSIQLLSSNKQLGLSDPQFHGLAPLSVYKENNLYKYTYGEHKTKSEAEKVLRKIKGEFPDAKVIESYKNQ
ncbi:MAG: N-acetylmuramoyl-L-alanine amidase [Clostridium sp.]|nr:N-acetylmuramoyl-L-alanine amidase [Prevotella sp.]MCM1428842.1 N-acetylmuramoyl-L-alanine amidase [Clostridium sp.]MCM1475217.1 N-acetylmuramoyl-L-alanine amidase [Muribaculaceae bacterium]